MSKIHFLNHEVLILAVSAFFLFTISSCKRSEPRLQPSIDALHWSGGTNEDRRVRDLLLVALQKATTASLATPDLVAVTAAIPNEKGKKGILRMDWIGASPTADSIRILLSNGEVADFPFDPIEQEYNEHESLHLLIYSAVEFAERDQPLTWGKIVADHGAMGVLFKDSKIISNKIPLVFYMFSPTAPTTQKDLGKFITTRDVDGHAWMYFLTHDVKAGDPFKIADVIRGELNDGTGFATGKDGYIDITGPSAFVGRSFIKNHLANEILDTAECSLAPSAPAPMLATVTSSALQSAHTLK